MAEPLKIIAIEEHVALQPVMDAYKAAGLQLTPQLGFGDSLVARRLRDVGELRLADMDDQGIDVAVLSLTTPGVQNLSAADAIHVAHDVNDLLAEIVDTQPDRFQALAAIPTADPKKAAAELERAVTILGLKGAMIYGRTGTTHSDSDDFDELYATAARLGVPLHFHPQMPSQQSISALYSDTTRNVDIEGVGSAPIGLGLATAGIGWYYEAGIEHLRMIFSGVFDRYPTLQVIAGHWGELVLFYLDHTQNLASMAGLERTLIDYYRNNFFVAGSGTISQRYLRWVAEMVGTDRMLYSTDYPYTFQNRSGEYRGLDTSAGVGRSFLENAPFTDEDKLAIASGNWERLTDSGSKRSTIVRS